VAAVVGMIGNVVDADGRAAVAAVAVVEADVVVEVGAGDRGGAVTAGS